VTDEKGRFSVEDIPVGSYAIVASRATFITSAYGAQRPARRGRPVSVAAGLPVADLVVRLWRGAVVSGTVRDELGRPVPGQPVHAIPATASAAVYLTLTNNPTATDQRGEFRIFGLEPGEYFLAAPPQASPQAATLLRDAHVDRVLDALRRTGRGLVEPSVGVTAEPMAAPTVVDSPVYWPGTSRAADAVAIAVGPGVEQTGLDLTLTRVPTAAVAGRVTLPDGGGAVGASVRLSDVKALPQLRALPTSFTTAAGRDGLFEIAGVPAGSYQLSASLTVSDTGDGSRRRPLWAAERLEASGSEVRGAALHLRPGLAVSGRVQIVDAGGSISFPPGASLALMPANVGYVSPTASLEEAMGGAAIKPDGTFVIPDLKPDAAYRLFVNGLGEDVWPVSAVVGGIDLFDGPHVLGSGPLSESLVVTFSRTHTELFGTLTGAELISPIFVVAFPVNREHWAHERRTRAVQPDTNGRYRFDNLPPGEYWIGAIGDVDPNAWKSPSFLELLEKQALKVVLEHGERRQVDIRTR